MHSIWRAVTLGIVVTLAVVLGVNVTNLSAQASDPRVGTWKLNVAKSKYSPGPAPQSQTLKVEASGKGEKVTSEVVGADGKRNTSTYTANFDGKDYPLSGSLVGADKEALKRDGAGRLRVAKVNVDEEPSLAGRYEIRSIPTILFVKDGRVVDTVIGAVPRGALDAKVAKHLSP